MSGREHIIDYLAALDGDEFAALVNEARPPKGNHVPGVGNSPDLRSAERAEIAAAEQAGDWATTFDRKAAQLHRLMRKEK